MNEDKTATQERIEELGSGLTRSEKGSVYTLTIIGQIEGHQVRSEERRVGKECRL